MSLQQAKITLNATLGGVSTRNEIISEADHPNPFTVDLPVSKAGTLTTRTDNSHGVVTMGAATAIITGDVVDVRWAGGIRFGMTSTVAGTAITLAGGTGTNLPATSTPVALAKQVSINTPIDGDNTLVACLLADYDNKNSVDQVHVDMQDSEGASIYSRTLLANRPKFYDLEDDQETNPFTGNDIAVTKASNASLTAVATLNLLFHEDATP